jgi:hypothetical protein
MKANTVSGLSTLTVRVSGGRGKRPPTDIVLLQSLPSRKINSEIILFQFFKGEIDFQHRNRITCSKKKKTGYILGLIKTFSLSW